MCIARLEEGPRHNDEGTIDQAQFRKMFKHAQHRKIQGYHVLQYIVHFIMIKVILLKSNS